MTTEPATAGHNNPPEPTPFEAASEEITGLYGEAKNFLDGEKITNQGMADSIAQLLNLIRAARKTADAARKVEAKPFDDGKAEVQGRYNPLFNKADLATTACKQALAPWLEKLDAEKKAVTEKARLEAEEAKRVAQEAIRAADADNLAEREAAEALLEEAKAAEIASRRAAKDTAKASGGVGRAASLRTDYKPKLTDPVAAARHYWQVKRPEMEAFLTGLAEKDLRAGVGTIPGFDIVEERKVV